MSPIAPRPVCVNGSSKSAETTPQQRALPSFFGALSDADPVTRRRSLLIAAALLVALALASAAAVGAWRQLHRDPLPELQLERPADVPAFVLSSHDRMPQLPPVAFTTLKSDGTETRIYVDRSGAVRIEGYASADATVPARTTILNGTSIGGTAHVGSKTVWLVDDEVISDDPRVFILSLSGLGFSDVPGCETSVDPSEAGTATAATGWRYVGADSVAGRPAHHLTCAAGDLWIDDATRLILRVRQPDLDDGGNPVPGGAVHTTEVTKIEFGEQPAGLFALTPPNGVEAMSSEEYRDLCPGDTTAFAERPCSGTPPAASRADAGADAKPDAHRASQPRRLRDPATRREQADRPPGLDRGEPQRDWPAPVRPEPAGGASVMPMPPTYIDPSGDTGSAVLPCIDIRDVTIGDYVVSLDLVATARRTWIHRRHGSHTAWSSTRTATASRIGATGSTTCPAPPGMRTATIGSGGRISTRVKPSRSREIGLGQRERELPRHRLPGRRSAGRGLPRSRCSRFDFGHVFDTTAGTKPAA